MKPETIAVLESSRYEKQAQDFLDKFSIKFRATLSNTKVCAWDDRDHGQERNHYRVTLSRHGFSESAWKETPIDELKTRINSRLTFDYWGSIIDCADGKHPTPYDVLAYISGDVHCPESFEDFCDEFGYERDSIKALQTYRRVAAFSRRLKSFFTSEEIEALSEIR